MPRPVTPPAATATPVRTGHDRHVWDRMAIGWHIVFGLFVVLTAVLVAIDQGIGPGPRIVALVVLAAMSGWYVIGGRALAERPQRLGLIYVTGAGVGVITLFALVPVGSLMLFMFFPHIWSLLPARRAVVGTVVTLAAVSAVSLAESERYGTNLGMVLVYGIVGLLTALLLGMWITRVIEQSRQRAELVAELSATRAELAAASHEAGVLAERERLAREIHDTLAQGFTSILLLLDALENEIPANSGQARRHLELIRRSARNNLAEARALVTAATPVDLADAPLTDPVGRLAEAVDRLAERIGHETGIAAHHETAGCPRNLPVRHEVVLLRVAQEALANVRRHAHATEVRVRLDYEKDLVSLEVRDNGEGFDPSGTARPDDGSGFGLAGMRRRVEQVGGSLRIHSAPGSGTAVVVRLPDGGAAAGTGGGSGDGTGTDDGSGEERR